MSKKVIILIALAITATLVFAACERSAANPVLATPTEAGSTSLPTGISLVQAWGTATAMSQQTAAAQGVVTPTPQVTADLTQVPPTGSATTPGVTTPGAGTQVPVILVLTLTPGHPSVYTLQKGEFPYCIARRFNVDPAALLAANGLTVNSAQALQPGLQLTIPAGSTFPGPRALTAHPATYTVQVDDTIYKVACHFGDVDPTSIAMANNITLTTPLTTGQVLNIP